jgi:hypothetical protein
MPTPSKPSAAPIQPSLRVVPDNIALKAQEMWKQLQQQERPDLIMRMRPPSPETWNGEQFAVLTPKSICARNLSFSGGGRSLPRRISSQCRQKYCYEERRSDLDIGSSRRPARRLLEASTVRAQIQTPLSFEHSPYGERRE